MKKSVAVLGLGKYGRSLAQNLYHLGADVLAVDENEDKVDSMSQKCTSAVCANLAEEDEVAALGLKNMDIVVTAMGSNLGASILAVTVAKEQGVPMVIAKSSSPRMTSLLKKVGADKVVNPEGEDGLRSAKVIISSSFKDVFELDDNMYMVEMSPEDEWIGRSIKEISLRKTRNLNVVAIRREGGSWSLVNPNVPITPEDVLLVVSERNDNGADLSDF